MSLHLDAAPAALVGFPRVSGDEPDGKLTLEDIAKFSPRERG